MLIRMQFNWQKVARYHVCLQLSMPLTLDDMSAGIHLNFIYFYFNKRLLFHLSVQLPEYPIFFFCAIHMLNKICDYSVDN